MTTIAIRLRKQIAINTAWLLLLLLVTGALVGGALRHLSQKREEVAQLRAAILEQRARLEEHPELAITRVRLGRMEAAVTKAISLAHSESDRMKSLLTVARRSSTVIESVRSMGTRSSEDGDIVLCTHALRGTGTFRQVASLLEGIQTIPGIASMEKIRLEPNDAKPGTLWVSFRITWCSPGPKSPYRNAEGAR